MGWDYLDAIACVGGLLATLGCVGLVLLAFDAARDTFPPMTDEERDDMLTW